MTAAEARRIIHPDTTVEALAEIEYYGGFSGKAAKKAAVDEACLVACAALDKQIPTKPYNRCKLGEKMLIGTCPTCGDGGNSKYPYCSKCGQALDWEVNDAQAGKN